MGSPEKNLGNQAKPRGSYFRILKRIAESLVGKEIVAAMSVDSVIAGYAVESIPTLPRSLPASAAHAQRQDAAAPSPTPNAAPRAP